MVLKLTRLSTDLWESRMVPTDWQNGFIVPKEGSPHQLANSHITLSTRRSFLQYSARKNNDAVDSQLWQELADFRCGRSCNDQIFISHNRVGYTRAKNSDNEYHKTSRQYLIVSIDHHSDLSWRSMWCQSMLLQVFRTMRIFKVQLSGTKHLENGSQ